jgi:hypothetical protein
MLDLQPDHLAGAQAAATAETAHVREVADDGEQAPRLVRAAACYDRRRYLPKRSSIRLA